VPRNILGTPGAGEESAMGGGGRSQEKEKGNTEKASGMVHLSLKRGKTKRPALPKGKFSTLENG